MRRIIVVILDVAIAFTKKPVLAFSGTLAGVGFAALFARTSLFQNWEIINHAGQLETNTGWLLIISGSLGAAIAYGSELIDQISIFPAMGLIGAAAYLWFHTAAVVTEPVQIGLMVIGSFFALGVVICRDKVFSEPSAARLVND